MDDCVFCRIASGEIRDLRVYEDEHTLAFMDTAMDVDGHMLVIPKAHAVNILDCDNDTLCRVFSTVKKVSNHLVDNCGYHGVDILCANGEAAGQSMLHFHVHIIPRRDDDGLGGQGAWPSFPGAKMDIICTGGIRLTSNCSLMRRNTMPFNRHWQISCIMSCMERADNRKAPWLLIRNAKVFLFRVPDKGSLSHRRIQTHGFTMNLCGVSLGSIPVLGKLAHGHKPLQYIVATMNVDVLRKPDVLFKSKLTPILKCEDNPSRKPDIVGLLTLIEELLMFVHKVNGCNGMRDRHIHHLAIIKCRCDISIRGKRNLECSDIFGFAKVILHFYKVCQLENAVVCKDTSNSIHRGGVLKRVTAIL